MNTKFYAERLVEVIYQDDKKEARQIISECPDAVNFQFSDGTTPLFYAFDLFCTQLYNKVYHSEVIDFSMIDLLLENNPDLSIKNNQNQTLFMKTFYQALREFESVYSYRHVSKFRTSYVKLLQKLADKGANIDERDKKNSNPLIKSARYGRSHILLIQFFLENGVNPYHRDHEGRSCLCCGGKSAEIKGDIKAYIESRKAARKNEESDDKCL